MSEPKRTQLNAPAHAASNATCVSLPVVPGQGRKPRKSRMSRRRAGVLIAVHVLMVAHVVQWLATGRTVSPIEPSEAMYTLIRGELNAGFVFFGAAILATLLLGRFVCGWGCHFIAYQDLCNWLLKKIGIRPKPLRSRLLILAPLALAVYMFVWPTAYRMWMGGAQPTWTNHLTTGSFWATFPGPGVAILTVLLAGGALVYFLGAKGFCTYACPYGGFFGLADKFAAGRILVTDACQHCGHCTAACTSNVKVHAEVARYGMVVDPGCMKCMDCITVCPNDALHYGFAVPPVYRARASGFSPRGTPDTRTAGVNPRGLTSAPHPPVFDFTLWEEFLMVGVGIAVLLALRGLYRLFPLLLAMAVAVMTAYLTLKLLRLVRDVNVRIQNLQLKKGSRFRPAGVACILATLAWLGLVVHGGVIQWSQWRGQVVLRSLQLPDRIWSPEVRWSESATPAQRSLLSIATTHLERADAWGLLTTPVVLEDLIWLYLAGGRTTDAERAVRRLIKRKPADATLQSALATVLIKSGRTREAEAACRRALTLDPTDRRGRQQLAELLMTRRRYDDAAALYREALDLARDDITWPIALARILIEMHRPADARRELELMLERMPSSAEGHSLLGVCLLQIGEPEAGLAHLKRATALLPGSGEARFNLGMAYLELRRAGDAVPWLQQAVELNPDFARGRYNLGVALYMAGRPHDALPHIREAIRLAPGDPDARGFLKVLWHEIDQSGTVTEVPVDDN